MVCLHAAKYRGRAAAPINSAQLHPGVVESSSDWEEIAGRVHVVSIEQGHGKVRGLARFA